jgi:SAM-dependent methyltransferase
MLCEAVDLRSGSRVLDVACGHGNTTLAAARRWCHVVGVDFVRQLLEQARVRAAAERLPATFQIGDAETLDFPRVVRLRALDLRRHVRGRTGARRARVQAGRQDRPRELDSERLRRADAPHDRQAPADAGRAQDAALGHASGCKSSSDR